jgi:hypothetical protein
MLNPGRRGMSLRPMLMDVSLSTRLLINDPGIPVYLPSTL